MPPQNVPASQPTPPAAPGQFDFMMKQAPKPPGRFSSLLSGVPRPVKLGLAAVGGLVVLIILYSLFFGGKTTNTDQLVSVAARAQEIARVSILVQTGSKNADTIGLAVTTSASFSSEEQQIKSYLKTNKVSVSTGKLAANLDKTTDTLLTTAQQNNDYDQAYFSYLETSLNTYQNDLTAAYKGAGKNARVILDAAYTNAKTLLSAPQLK